MTPNDLQAARDLVADATPGPWVALGNDVANTVNTCTCYGGNPYGHEQFCGIEGQVITGASPTNAELIAAAPDLITKLLDHVAALETKFEQMQAKAITSEVGLYREIENSQRLGTERDKARNSLNGVTRTRDRYAAQVTAVRDLHKERPNSRSALYPEPLCSCGMEYPCPTVQALDEEPPLDPLDPATLN